jgi:replicative DNA helicase
VKCATYLASLPNAVPTALNAEHYAAIVLEKATLRALIGAGSAITSLGYEGGDEELSEIARALKSMAKELEVPLTAISQLSRAAEGLGSRRPMLNHLRESGELEAVADVVLFLYWEDYYDVEKAQREGKENICEVVIAKHRNGPVGIVELYFDKAISRFSNLERRR